MIRVNFYKEIACPISLNFVKKIVVAAAGREKQIGGIVAVIIVDDKRIKQLNSRYRGKHSVTDVLSFAWQEDKKVKSEYLGEVYLCYPQIYRQAQANGVALNDELALMLVHGLLHLAGYDHKTRVQEKLMFALQKKIVNSI